MSDSDSGILSIDSDATLILRDSSEEKEGSISATKVPGSFIVNHGTCIFESGKYEVQEIKNVEYGYGMIATSTDADLDANGNLKGKGVLIKGGSFRLGNVGKGSNGSPWLINVGGKNEGNVIVTGGTFNADIQNQYWIFEVEIPKEYALKDNGKGTYTIVDAVCYVNVQHKSGNWYTYPYGCETFEEALSKINWYVLKDDAFADDKLGDGETSEGTLISGYGNTITMFDECCIDDLRLDILDPNNQKEFNLVSEKGLYTLNGTTLSDKVHCSMLSGGNNICDYHVSSSNYSCLPGNCIKCHELINPAVEHSIDLNKKCIDQNCKKCGSLVIAEISHNYKIVDNHKVCSMCGHTVPLTMSGGTEGIISPDNKTTQNSSNQLEVSDIVTGTMVVIAVAILGMIIFDVVRKP